MRIDVHTHIFPEAIRTARAHYFCGEPAFALLYRQPASKLAAAADLVETMDAQQIDKAVVFGFPWKNPETARRHNDYIREAAEHYPGRLIPFACFDVLSDEAVREAERCVENGFSGLGELALYDSGFDRQVIGRLAPLMAICLENNLPVLIHTNEPVGHAYPGKAPLALGQIYDLIRSFPNNTLILAHWGGGIFFYHLARKEVKGSLEHVYFDTAASPFLYDPAIFAIAVQIVGKEKILFGSDFPLLPPDRYFDQMRAQLSSSDIDCICGDNAARLFGF